MNWHDAQMQMKAGRKVRRPRWHPKSYVVAHSDVANLMVSWEGESLVPYAPLFEGRHATDWEVAT